MKILTTSLFHLISTTLLATNYFVDASFGAGGDGSSSRLWNQLFSIQSVSLFGGDTVFIAKGNISQRSNKSYQFRYKFNAQLSKEQMELKRLRKKLADVEMERDILKKAVSIFSVSDRKFTGL